MTPENDTTCLHTSTARLMSPLDSYSSTLSPMFEMSLNSPYLCHLSPSQPLPTDSPDLGQLQQALQLENSSSSPGRFHLNRSSPFNGPHHGYHSPSSPIASTSSPMIWTDFRHSPMSLACSNASISRPLNTLAQSPLYTARPDLSKPNWFKSCVEYGDQARSPPSTSCGSHLGNLFRTFVRRLDTYEIRKEQQVSELSWSMILLYFAFDLFLRAIAHIVMLGVL